MLGICLSSGAWNLFGLLISAGTERMLVEFGQANLPAKARVEPDKVRQVLDKIRTDT